MATTQEDRTTPAAQPAVQPAAEVAPVSFSEDLTAAQVRLYVNANFPTQIWKILDDHEHKELFDGAYFPVESDYI